MINVGDFYISSENIKSINYEMGCIVITYFFDCIPVRIPVIDANSYYKEAEHILNIMARLRKENVDNNK